MKFLILSTFVIFITSCASLTPEEQRSITRIFNTDGCQMVGQFTGKSGGSFNNAQVYAIRQAINAGANGYVGGALTKSFPNMYATLYGYRCANITQNGPTIQQIQAEHRAAAGADQVQQQQFTNTIKAIHYMNQSMDSYSPTPIRSPASKACRTRSFTNSAGQIIYTTDCQ